MAAMKAAEVTAASWRQRGDGSGDAAAVKAATAEMMAEMMAAVAVVVVAVMDVVADAEKRAAHGPLRCAALLRCAGIMK